MGGACIYQTLLHSTGIDFLEVLLDLCQGRTPKLSQGPAVPTIAHALWVDREGTISKIAGEVELTRSPLYVEHQLYDDIGAHAKRAPLSSRGSGHVIYRSVEGFGSIERELSDRLRHFRLEVEGSVPSFSQRRYTA
jgi:hypothetical protein